MSDTSLYVILIFAALMVIGGIIAFFWINPPGPTDPQEKIKAQQDKVDPNASGLKNAVRRTRMRSYTDTQKVANEATAATTEGIKLQTEAETAAEVTESNVNVHLSTNDTTISSNERRQAEDALHKVMLDRARDHGIPYVVFEQEMMKERLDELELKRLAKEKQIILEAGFIYQLRDYHKLTMIRAQVDQLIREIDEVRNDKSLSDFAKGELEQIRRDDMQMLLEDARGRRKRLLQTIDRDDVRTGDEDADV